LAGVSQGSAATYTPGTTMTENQDYRVPLQVDGSALSSGPHTTKTTVTQNYSATSGSNPASASIGNSDSDLVGIVNNSASPLGAGWSIAGLQQLNTGTTAGPVMINDVAVITAGGTAKVLSNDGMGNLTVPSSGATASSSPVDIAAGDFNGDG